MSSFSIYFFYIIILIVAFTAFYPKRALEIFLTVVYLPLRRLLGKMDGFDKKKIQRRVKKFQAKLPWLVSFFLWLLAFPLLWFLRLFRKLMGMDEKEYQRSKEFIEDLDRFIDFEEN